MKNMTDKPNPIVIFEGPDGAGKTTLIEKVSEHYAKTYGVELPTYRQPGATWVGEKVRSIFQEGFSTLSPETKALLMQASQMDFVEIFNKKIGPSLKPNQFVLLDRFCDSTVAYQCYGEMQVASLAGLNWEGFFIPLWQSAIEIKRRLNPSLTLLLELDYENSQKNLLKSGKPLDTFDTAGKDFFERVRKGYGVRKTFDKTLVSLDASKPMSELVSETLEILSKHFPIPSKTSI